MTHFFSKLINMVRDCVPLLKKNVLLDITPLPVEKKFFFIIELYKGLTNILLLFTANLKFIEEKKSEINNELLLLKQKGLRILAILLSSLKNNIIPPEQIEELSKNFSVVRSLLVKFLQTVGNLSKTHVNNKIQEC